MSELRTKTINGFLWRLAQSFGTQAINFIIGILIARMLLPEDYGLIAITNVFVTLANVFVIYGFSSAIIQRENISDIEISSIFHIGNIASVVLFLLLFFLAPSLSTFYSEPQLTLVLRVQALSLVIQSLYSVQQSLITRQLKFRTSFFIGVASSVFHGTIGILLALNGYGVWALVISSLTSYFVSGCLYWCVSKWRPKLRIDFGSVKSLFSYNSKILFSSLLNTLYGSLRSLIIGKKYDSETLGYYNKGSQFPTTIMNSIDGAMTSVLFASLSRVQNNPEERLRLLRRSMKMSMFVCAPIMMGLTAVARSMVVVFLTEKWLDSVPFVRIMALTCLLWPLSAKIQAINSIGRSDITLKINIFDVGLSIILVIFATLFLDIFAIAYSAILSTIIVIFVTSLICVKLFGYSIKSQICDVLPPFLLSIFMGILAYLIEFFGLSAPLTLMIQILLGVFVYFGGAFVFKFESLNYSLGFLKSKIYKTK